MLHRTVSDVREAFVHMLEVGDFVEGRTPEGTSKMLELRGASFLADESAIFGEVNWDYVRREIEWYDSQSLCVNDIPDGPPGQWKKSASRDGFVNSNYGWVVYSIKNYSQYAHVLDELQAHPDSRRAVMIYTRPSMWYVYNRDGMSDFMCTNAVQYFVRDGALEVVVQMRSNDVVFGYKNDRAWQVEVQSRLATDLGIPMGTMTWQVGSLHVYERHFHLVK